MYLYFVPTYIHIHQRILTYLHYITRVPPPRNSLQRAGMPVRRTVVGSAENGQGNVQHSCAEIHIHETC